MDEIVFLQQHLLPLLTALILPFSTAHILTCDWRKAQVLLITLTLALFYLRVPMRRDSMTVTSTEAGPWK